MVAAESLVKATALAHPLRAVLVKTVRRRLVGDVADPHALEAGPVVEESDDVGRRQASLALVHAT